jgi:uncharacterized membrane protein
MHHHHHHMGPPFIGFGRRRWFGRRGHYHGHYGPRPGCGGFGCLTIPVTLIVIIMLASIFSLSAPGRSASNQSGGAPVTLSTIRREPLAAGSVNETGYYRDELGWIGNSTILTAGMKNFYRKTGVQPFLYITDNFYGDNNPKDADAERFAANTYDELFTDEAHLLLIFFEYDNNYHTWYMAGSQAKAVLDGEAMDILLDGVDKYYYDQNLTEEQMFSKAFDEAGTKIMTVTASPWIPAIIVAGALAILIVIFLWWKSNKRQKNLEAEQDQKIMDTPLETFGGSDAEARAKKYEE